MGQLLTKISTTTTTASIDDKTSTIINENNSISIKSFVRKRKYFDYEQTPNKRKLDENNRFIYSARRKSSLLNRTLSPMIVFKCQLCDHCFSTKDSYLNHLMRCAIEHKASIKIVRANRPSYLHSHDFLE